MIQTGREMLGVPFWHPPRRSPDALPLGMIMAYATWQSGLPMLSMIAPTRRSQSSTCCRLQKLHYNKVTVLKGQAGEVARFAGQVIAERGVTAGLPGDSARPDQHGTACLWMARRPASRTLLTSADPPSIAERILSCRPRASISTGWPIPSSRLRSCAGVKSVAKPKISVMRLSTRIPPHQGLILDHRLLAAAEPRMSAARLRRQHWDHQ